MSDLSELFKVAPLSAAFQTGQNQAQGRQTEGLRQQELQQLIESRLQKMKQDQLLNPLMVEHQGLQNENLRLGQPRLREEGIEAQLKNQITQGTLGSTIASTNAKNTGVVGAEGAKDAERMHEAMTEAAAMLEQVPPAMRMQTFQQLLQARGFTPQDPKVQGLLQVVGQQDANQLPQFFSKMSNQLGQLKMAQSPTAQQAITTTGMNNKNTFDTHAADRQAQFKLEEMKQREQNNRAATKAQNAQGKATDILAKVRSGQVSPEKAAIQFETLADLEEDPQKEKIYRSLAAKAEQMVYQKPGAGKAGDAALIDGELGNRPSPKPVMGQPRGGNAPPAPAPVSGQTKSGAKYTIIPN